MTWANLIAVVKLTKRLDNMAQVLAQMEHEMSEIDPRAFGQLEGAVKALTEKVGTLADDVEGMRAEVMKLTGVLSEARGGWRTLAWLSGAAATAGGGVTWLAQYLTQRGG